MPLTLGLGVGITTVPKQPVGIPSPQNKILSATATGYALSGTPSTLKLGRRNVATAGSYALTGTAATLTTADRIAALSGSYVMSGTAATFRRTYKNTADAGSYALSGNGATLTKGIPREEGQLGVNALDFAGADLGAKINTALTAGNLDVYVPNSSNLVISTTIKVLHACTLTFSNKYPDHIVCQTNGKPVFEAVGSVRHFRIKGGIFDGKITTTPSCFMLVGADEATHAQCGDTTSMSGVQVTGYWGYAAIIHIASEINTYENCHIWRSGKGSSAYGGPYATVMMSNMDYWTVPFQYTQPATTARSMSANAFYNCDVRASDGSVFLFKGQVEDTTLVPSYINAQGTAGITIEAGQINGGSWGCPRRLRIAGGGRFETNGHASSAGCPFILVDGKTIGGQGIYEMTVEDFGMFVGSTTNTTPVIKCQNAGVAYAMTAFHGCHVENTSVLFQNTVSDLSWADIRTRFSGKNIDCTGRTLDNCDIKINGSITASSAIAGNANRLRSTNVNVG